MLSNNMNNSQNKEDSTGCLTVGTIALIIIIVIASLSDFVERNTGALIVLSVLVIIWMIKKSGS